MTCSNVVSTSTGTFTFYGDFVSSCQARRKCIEKGQILAPITNRYDADKIVELFDSNYGWQKDCKFNTMYNSASYWVGLDIFNNGTYQERKFTNGIGWDEKTHGKIYTDYLKDHPTDCPVVVFQPLHPEKKFAIFLESDNCKIRKKARYVCLKPKEGKFAESVTQEKDSSKNMLTGVVFAAAMSVFFIAFVKQHIKNKKLAKALSLEQEKGRLMECSLKSVTTEGR